MKIKRFIYVFWVITLLATMGCGQTKTEPTKVTKTDKQYIYYLHGRIIEDLGADKAISQRFGKYEYEKILKAFEEKGFEVISEARPQNTDVEKYSKKLAKQIKKQIKSGVLPQNITVVGASKGSLIAMLTSTKLANKNVKFVIMANCNEFVQKNFDINLHGKILSVYEKTDTVGGNSCEAIKADSKGITKYKEIKINTKLDHGFLFKPLKEWFEPAVNWAKK